MIGGHRPGMLQVNSADDRRSWGILRGRVEAPSPKGEGFHAPRRLKPTYAART